MLSFYLNFRPTADRPTVVRLTRALRKSLAAAAAVHFRLRSFE